MVARFCNGLNVDSTILSLGAVSEVDLCQKTLFTTFAKCSEARLQLEAAQRWAIENADELWQSVQILLLLWVFLISAERRPSRLLQNVQKQDCSKCAIVDDHWSMTKLIVLTLSVVDLGWLQERGCNSVKRLRWGCFVAKTAMVTLLDLKCCSSTLSPWWKGSIWLTSEQIFISWYKCMLLLTVL